MRNTHPIILFLLAIQLSTTLSAQVESNEKDTITIVTVSGSDWIDKGIVMGGGLSPRFFGEVGYFRSYVYEGGGFPIYATTMSYGSEFSYMDEFIFAPKVQARLHLFLANLSLAALMYTNLAEDHAIKLRPQIGLGLWHLGVHYGYNIGLYNKGDKLSGGHVVGFSYYMALSTKHLNEYDRRGNIVD